MAVAVALQQHTRGRRFKSWWMLGFSSSSFLSLSFIFKVSLIKSLKEVHLELCVVKKQQLCVVEEKWMTSCAAWGQICSLSSDWV